MIQFAFNIAGATPDSTPTLGIVRTDTGASVVAAGTLMTDAGAGNYSYNFTGDTAGIGYQAAFTVFFGGEPVSWQSAVKTSPATGGMTLTTARDIVRRRLKSGNDTSRYADSDIDDAILLVGNDFVDRTGCTAQSDSIAITASNDQVDFSSIDGFRAGRLRKIAVDADVNYAAELVRDGIDITSIEEIRRQQGIATGASSVPALLGFTSLTQATLYPSPQYDGTLSLWWSPPFVSFTSGTATPDEVTLNIPPDLIYPVLIYGATVIVQLTEVENIEKVLRGGAYERHVQSSLGRATIEPKYVQRIACAQV